jgi:hypothetical protein
MACEVALPWRAEEGDRRNTHCDKGKESDEDSIDNETCNLLPSIQRRQQYIDLF